MEARWWIPKWLAGFTLFTLWHKDPDRKGDDDSCGWFKRARHGDKAVLEKIVKRFEFDWDGVFKSDDGSVYPCGYFNVGGMPRFSVHGIVLNLMFLAGIEVLGSRKTASRFCQKNLFEILLFAENPTDSLHDTLTLKWGKDEKREERIRNLASCIYGYLLRETQPWYRHPRWHVLHWRLQIHFWQTIRRALFDRCVKCGRGFRWGETAISSWSGESIWHARCEDRVTQSRKPQCDTAA